MDQDILDRIEKLERKQAEHDGLIEFMMLLAAQYPVGRKILAMIAKGGRKK